MFEIYENQVFANNAFVRGFQAQVAQFATLWLKEICHMLLFIDAVYRLGGLDQLTCNSLATIKINQIMSVAFCPKRTTSLFSLREIGYITIIFSPAY